MKVFILCGGFGTRLDYEGTLIAKPMVRIGPDPILMHIIKGYCDQGYNDFVFCLGHKSRTIINYFFKKKIFFRKQFIIKNQISNLLLNQKI